MKNDMINWIINTLVDKYYLQLDQVTAGSIYDDLALDSLALLEIIATLEKEFKINILAGMITSNMSIEESVENILRKAA